MNSDYGHVKRKTEDFIKQHNFTIPDRLKAEFLKPIAEGTGLTIGQIRSYLYSRKNEGQGNRFSRRRADEFWEAFFKHAPEQEVKEIFERLHKIKRDYEIPLDDHFEKGMERYRKLICQLIRDGKTFLVGCIIASGLCLPQEFDIPIQLKLLTKYQGHIGYGTNHDRTKIRELEEREYLPWLRILPYWLYSDMCLEKQIEKLKGVFEERTVLFVISFKGAKEWTKQSFLKFLATISGKGSMAIILGRWGNNSEAIGLAENRIHSVSTQDAGYYLFDLDKFRD